jgi:flagellar hook assembly protein FlgD
MPGGKVRFNNLKDGDSVAIYNLKGKLIKKLVPKSMEAFVEWDGTSDKGGYVESGSYIYQVKADGKIISGSLAFVR